MTDLAEVLCHGATPQTVRDAVQHLPLAEPPPYERWSLGDGVTVCVLLCDGWGPAWWINWKCPEHDCAGKGWHLLSKAKREATTPPSMNPSHDLTAARSYAARHRADWHADVPEQLDLFALEAS